MPEPAVGDSGGDIWVVGPEWGQKPVRAGREFVLSVSRADSAECRRGSKQRLFSVLWSLCTALHFAVFRRPRAGWGKSEVRA